MKLDLVGVRSEKKVNPKQVNEEASIANEIIRNQQNKIPDEAFDFAYKLYGTDRVYSLRKIFEVDVNELSEMTITNLRVALEVLGSIRVTLERAYEQMMEDYGRSLINYDIWWAEKQEFARQMYWNEQVALSKKHDLAKSGMKAPTQDDLLFTALRVVGIQVDYELKKNEHIKYQRQKSLFEKIDSILQSRSYEIISIVKSRSGQDG